MLYYTVFMAAKTEISFKVSFRKKQSYKYLIQANVSKLHLQVIKHDFVNVPIVLIAIKHVPDFLSQYQPQNLLL